MLVMCLLLSQTCTCPKGYDQKRLRNTTECELISSVSWASIVIPVMFGVLGIIALAVALYVWQSKNRVINNAAYKQKGPPGQPHPHSSQVLLLHCKLLLMDFISRQSVCAGCLPGGRLHQLTRGSQSL